MSLLYMFVNSFTAYDKRNNAAKKTVLATTLVITFA